MNDRELLELAAKSAGLKIDKSKLNGGGVGNAGFDMLGNAVIDWHNGVTWNPLTDDGDALWLAVHLRLLVVIDNDATGAQRLNEFFVSESHGDDPWGATRRAIVRAAAEIGRRMQEAS